MKKKNFVKVLTITLCLTAIFSTVVMAKENKQHKYSRVSVSAIVPHPTEDDFPD